MGLFKRRNKSKNDPDFIVINCDRDKAYEYRFTSDGQEVTINKQKVQIETDQNSDGFDYVIYQNKKYPFEIVDKNDNKYTVKINDVCYSFSIETPTSFKRREFIKKSQKTSKHENFLAPMPGKIIEMLVDEGSDVNEGDPLFILEAMKMQNEIISHVSGHIKSIKVKAGDSVGKDDTLLIIEKQ